MTYSLLTRTAKGTKLTIPEMDGNLYYLRDLALSSSGPTGSIGPQGYTGATGADGMVGPQGYTGATGADGMVGPQGYTGATGADGMVGPQGYTGATGADGMVGATGADGMVGATGPAGTASTVDYLLIEIDNAGYTASSAMNMYSPIYSVGIGLSGSNQIILNPDNLPNKAYFINTSFYIYNNYAAPYSYTFKLNGVAKGIDINLGQNANVAGYEPRSISTIVNTTGTSVLEFWKTNVTVYAFNIIGQISIYSI